MNERDLLNSLIISDTISQKINFVRKIRNTVIGNRKRKRIFLSHKAIQILIELWTQNASCVDLLTELATVIGSLTLGDEEAVHIFLQNDIGIDLLLKGLCSSNILLVTACLKALRSVYSVDITPTQFIYQDNNIIRKLVALLLYPSPLNESAATILSRTCQTQDQQNFLFANGIVSNLFTLLISPSPKVVTAGIVCLSSIIKNNSFTSAACTDCIVPGSSEDDDSSLLTLLVNLITYSPSYPVKLNVAICLAQLFNANAIAMNDPILTMKLLPCLVSLCKYGMDDTLRVMAADTIAELVTDNIQLQEIAVNTDNLLSILSEFFIDKPNEQDQSISNKTIIQYNNLRKSALLLLACLSTSVEDIRFQVVTKCKVMKYITDAIECEVVDVKIAAAKCLWSLSRSPKLLRTYLSDAEVWKGVVSMLSSIDEECIEVSCSLSCNLLHSFCPSRESMVIDGIIPVLSRLTSHTNPLIQLNAVWALMNCSRDGSEAIIKKIRTSLSVDHIILMIQSQQNNERLIVKCLGLLTNLTQSVQDTDSIMSECHSLPQFLGSLMALSLSDDIHEQAMCVLVNLSNGNFKNRNKIAECDTVTKCLSQLLRTNCNTSILLACCKLVHNLADIESDDHTHRQNCLEESGVQHYLQKLEMAGSNSQLQETARQVLEQLQTASL